MEQWNYFNYFTEIEEYFWKKRGSHLLVSPLDWAIMETWQKAGVPLDAVLVRRTIGVAGVALGMVL